MKVDKANELLAEALHLWIDAYIVKNPTSHAPESISNGVFERIHDWLDSNGIEVDYCGWRYKVRAARCGRR